MAATNCKSSLNEKRFSNSEVDLRSNEAQNSIRYAKRMGANLKEAKKAAIIRKKEATFKQLFEKCWKRHNMGFQGKGI